MHDVIRARRQHGSAPARTRAAPTPPRVSRSLAIESWPSVLAYESRSLSIGERARPAIIEDVHRRTLDDAAVVTAPRPLTMHFGPHEI